MPLFKIWEIALTVISTLKKAIVTYPYIYLSNKELKSHFSVSCRQFSETIFSN